MKKLIIGMAIGVVGTLGTIIGASYIAGKKALKQIGKMSFENGNDEPVEDNNCECEATETTETVETKEEEVTEEVATSDEAVEESVETETETVAENG